MSKVETGTIRSEAEKSPRGPRRGARRLAAMRWFYLMSLLPATIAWAQEPGSQDPGVAGAIALEEARCGACHTDYPEPRPGPDLSDVGARVDPGYLVDFLLDPSAHQPGSRMPDLVESEQDARDLVQFLVRGSDYSGRDLDADAAKVGQRLFHAVGCVACHGPRVATETNPDIPVLEDAVLLDHVPKKYGDAGLTEFLLAPLDHRPEGFMPDLALTRTEARAIAHYLLQEAPQGVPGFQTAGDAKRGRQLYEDLGCARCHTQPDVPAAAPSLGTAGCVRAAHPGAADAKKLLGAARLEQVLSGHRCTACHERDGYGGVDVRLIDYFETTEPELGNDARVPPPLTLAGAKLKPEWLDKVLHEGTKVRPYMATRMPRFGSQVVGELPELFASLDEVEPFPLRAPERGDEDRAWRDAGRTLAGNKGLACVACHDFNGKPSPVFGGVDLITSPDRLQYDWFARFLIEPEKYRPGVVMPKSWAGGVPSSDLLEASTEAQIQALWHYLRLGRSAADPSGIRVERAQLDVGEKTLTYRGRNNLAGFRGIAVGSPEGLHYSFDAYTGTMRGLWRGDFVSVSWQGQGAGDFHPRGRVAELPGGVAFTRLKEDESPWPEHARPTKEEPVDPMPLYPRTHGYRFAGYHLDKDDVPTLRYHSGDVFITDRSLVHEGRLVRSLTFETEKEQRLYLRLLGGELERLSRTQVRSGRVTVTHPAGAIDTDGDVRLPLDLTAGTTALVLSYELSD